MKNQLRFILVGLAAFGVSAVGVSADGASSGEVDSCYGITAIEIIQGWPIGPSSLDCVNPCEQVCQQTIVWVTLPSGYKRGAKCKCSAAQSPSNCCQMVLVPPGSQGTPWSVGDCGTLECPAGTTCNSLSAPSGGYYNSQAVCD